MTPVEQDPARELVARLRRAIADPAQFCARDRWPDTSGITKWEYETIPRWGARAAQIALEPLFAAARESGYAQARAEDIAALRDQANARAESGLYGDNGSCLVEAADYLASLTPTQEVPDGR